jgi:hypothetical protein
MKESIYERAKPAFPNIDNFTIWAEAYNNAVLQRFNLGLFKDCFGLKEREASSFLSDDSIKFRLKIVNENDPSHPIILWKDQIHPNEIDAKGKRKGILDVKKCAIAPLIWDIDFETSGYPKLLIDNSLPEDVVVSKTFSSLVLPAVLKSILTHLLEGDENQEELQSNKWIIYAEKLIGEPCDKESDEGLGDYNIEWISKVVRAFTKKQAFLTIYREEISK